MSWSWIIFGFEVEVRVGFVRIINGRNAIEDRDTSLDAGVGFGTEVHRIFGLTLSRYFPCFDRSSLRINFRKSQPFAKKKVLLIYN